MLYKKKQNHSQKKGEPLRLPFIQRFKDKITHISKIGPDFTPRENSSLVQIKSLRSPNNMVNVDPRVVINKSSNLHRKTKLINNIIEASIEKNMDNKQNMGILNELNQKLTHKKSLKKKSSVIINDGQADLPQRLQCLRNMMKTIELPLIKSKQANKDNKCRYMMVMIQN